MIAYGIMQGRLTPSNGHGIQFFPFDNWKNEFIAAAIIGLEEIEFIFDYDNYMNNPLWSEEGVSELHYLIEKTGVHVKSLCFDYFMRRPFYKYPVCERDAVRKENKDFLLRMFSAMKEIGGELIEIPSVDNSSLKNAEEKKLYAAFLKEVESETKLLYEGIRIGLETDLPVDDFIRFIDNLGCSRIGANYDSGNSSGLGYDLYQEVTSLRSRIFNIHIKDRIYHGTTVALGTGSADFEALFRGLREIGYKESFIIQAARGKDGIENETIRSQKAFIEAYVKKYQL